MKNLKKKSIAILALFMISTFAGSMVSNATAEKSYVLPDDPDVLNAGLAQMFGMFREFGASGELLGEVLMMMFENFETMNATQEIDGVYVLNASVIKAQESGNFTYGEAQTEEYTPWGVYSLENATLTEDQDEYPYFLLNETGTIEYNKTEGVSITFIIWDDDGTFIDALDKLISTFKEFKMISEDDVPDEVAEEAALRAVISALTYFFIHVNDIITGDEVIVLNTIAFTNYVADFDGSIDANWYVTEEGVRTHSRLLIDALPTYDEDYTQIADYYRDEFMQYLLDENNFADGQKTQNYTSFSFDVIEIWLKEFQISIDSQAILGALAGEEGAEFFDDKTATDIFQELKLEFYVFTHHFQNWYLFDDNKFDKDYSNATTEIQDQAEAAVGNGVPDVLFEEIGTFEGEPVHAITDAEVVDYILFRGADSWEFKEPVYDAENNKMEWGIRAENLGFRVIPMGLNDDEISLTDAPVEYMEFMELGFSFEPENKKVVETDDYINAQGQETMGSAKVKLIQSFGQWDLDTDGKPFTPHLKNTSLDLTTVYMSTIFHFKLAIENKQIVDEGETPSAGLLNETNYDRDTHHIRVGDINQELPLADIDIAGPEYNQSGANTGDYPAETTIIPTVYAEFEGQSSETYEQEDTSIGQINATINIEFSTLIYAVSYPTFGMGNENYTTGDEIIHDPTFSVFITTINPGVIAIILVIGAVGLAGIAAVLITKKKNAQF
ncbi:hypothetical protein DSAG12_01158 [Promethearchaeum syntrophicum]|uniref:Uncharacterized protein n=1 Tax=Promethearchaeum syntrophicum TaxID=2594042 RepID=A0A5B9D8E5_9ARCH|nr:hypothetical protein [Candidatus Prometheoarchaeum syntrophicum]QEE15333.1 hypothetical protein DSAG12_01158 [Candidatus Prometheoarchaeum syntrophicum]